MRHQIEVLDIWHMKMSDPPERELEMWDVTEAKDIDEVY